MPPEDLPRFVRDHTQVVAPPLVPELRLHLATELTPLWTATELFLRRHGVEPPYWAFAWPGSIAVARWILDDPARVRGRRVMDFAAGGGLAALAAARAGARAVAVEIDPVAGAAVRLNAALNGVEVEVVVDDLPGGPPPEADLLVTGDVCYSRPMVDHLLPWLRRAAAAGVEVLLADPGRAYLPDGLEEVGRWDVPVSRELEDRDVRLTRLLRLRA